MHPGALSLAAASGQVGLRSPVLLVRLRATTFTAAVPTDRAKVITRPTLTD